MTYNTMKEKVAYHFQESKMLETSTYEVGGTSIEVTAREFLPSSKVDNPQEALILFQGWGPDVDAQSYDTLANSLAHCFNRRVLIVNTRAQQLIDDSLFHEAEAVSEFVKDQEISDLIIAGYSQGGAKATNLAAICQNQKNQQDQSINPEALLLFAPAGLSEQSPIHLVATFIQDVVLETMPRIALEKIVARSTGQRRNQDKELVQVYPAEPKRPRKAWESLISAKDVVKGVFKELLRSKLNPRRFLHEIREIAQLNPRLNDIKIPVILIQGKHDKPVAPQGDLSKEQMAKQDEDGQVKSALQTLFPSSPYANRILARRSANHALTLLRSPQIARVSAYLLERKKRKETSSS